MANGAVASSAAGTLRVAVVYGGASLEGGVSRRSALGVQAALREGGFAAELVLLELSTLAGLAERFDVVFPVSHGALGEDGCLQGYLEIAGLPYVGAAVRASANATHKPTAKMLFRDAGIPVATGIVVRSADHAAVVRVRDNFLGDVVIKPAGGGSAIGVTRLVAGSTDAEILDALVRAITSEDGALVEEWVKGDEVTCGVLELEAGQPRALPPTLVQAVQAEWYNFQSRYATDGSRHTCPAPYPAALIARIQESACAAHIALGVRDLSRSDFVVDPVTLTVTLLETNTLPGMTNTSLFPEAAGVAGYSMVELCRSLVETAFKRPRVAAAQAVPVPD